MIKSFIAATALVSLLGVGVTTSDVAILRTVETVSVAQSPEPEDSGRMSLTGQLVLTVDEPLAVAPTSSVPFTNDPNAVPTEAEGINYAVVTRSGRTVPIDGDAIPADARTGDLFTGTVDVPADVIADLDAEAIAILEFSTVEEPLPLDTEQASEVLDVAAALSVELGVVEAAVKPGLMAATTIATHELKIAVVTPAGMSALDYSDAKITEIATAGTGFWQSALIPTFTSQVVTRITSTSGCAQAPFSRWDEVAVSLGSTNAANYLAAAPQGVTRHLVVLLPPGCKDLVSSGVGTIGSNLHYGGLITAIFGVGVDRQVLAHELGHNMSLGHSNLSLCGPDSASAGCKEFEYMDLYDVMGASIAGQDRRIAVLNSRDQVVLDINTPEESHLFSLPAAAPTLSWNVELERLGGAGASVAEVIDPINGETYYLEYRAGESGNAFYADGNLLKLSPTQSVQLGKGVRLLRSTATNGSSAVATYDSGSQAYRPFAWIGNTLQNPSGSISLRVNGGDEAGGAIFKLTLTRSPVVTPPAVSGALPVYRFFSPTNNSHFYTISKLERDHIIRTYPSSTWTYEGERYKAFPAAQAGTVPLYRFYSPTFKGHFYTTNAAERDQVIAKYPDVWSYEGIAYHVYGLNSGALNTLTVARFWSENFKHHFYTASADEREAVKRYPAAVWSYEGDNFRVPAG